MTRKTATAFDDTHPDSGVFFFRKTTGSRTVTDIPDECAEYVVSIGTKDVAPPLTSPLFGQAVGSFFATAVITRRSSKHTRAAAPVASCDRHTR